MLRFLTDSIKKYFLSGLLVTVPLVVTFLALRFLFETIDGILAPVLIRIFGADIPGLGVISILILVLLAGFAARSLIGARLFKVWDSLLARAPLVRMIYSGAKQLMEGITTPDKSALKEVALLEYPRTGIYTLGFVVSYSALRRHDDEEDLVNVFIPHTPTPVTGVVILMPRSEVIILDLPVEEAIKFLVSGGIVAPEMFTAAKGKRKTKDSGAGKSS